MAKIEPFEKHTEQYENWFVKNRYAYQSEVRAIKEILPDFKDGIEIGIGSGKFAQPLGIRFGVEPSYEMRKIAEIKGIKVVDSVAENLPFKDGSFDLVLMVTTLCFLDDVKKAFSEVYRILKPDGFFINGFVDKNSKIGKIYQKNKQKSVFYRVAIFFTTDKVINLLKEASFKRFEFRQTIFNTLDKINGIEEIRKGYGEGSFVVVRAQKL